MDIKVVVIYLSAMAIGIGGFYLWTWMLVDCITNEPGNWSVKITWILVVMLIPMFGALYYFLVRRPQRIEEHGR